MNFFKVLLSFFGFGKKPKINSQQAIPRDDYEYNELKRKKENHLDAILEKIAEKGIESLTRREKEFLDSQSN
jgi:hypothetical protein